MAAAFYRIAESNPFPAIMGRVCPAPCQFACNRNQSDETISINAVEHAIGNYALENGLQFHKPKTSTGKRVAIIGGGPAGLSCAYHLARKGHHAVIFEKEWDIGGQMRLSIAEYRINRKVLDAEIQRILDLGVEVRTGVDVGKDVTLEELRNEYDSLFIGIGAQNGRMVPIPGRDAKGVMTAMQFLVGFHRGEDIEVGKKVVVIGDGDVSSDSVRMALRLGCKDVNWLSGVNREDMKVAPEEYEAAIAEGGKITMAAGTLEVLKNDKNKVTGLRVAKMQEKEKGESGWDSPVPFLRYKIVPGTEYVIECDTVISAIGQYPDWTGLEEINKEKSFLDMDKNGQVKGMPGVFCGGDVHCLLLLTHVIGHGKTAADSIDRYVNGKEFAKVLRPDIISFDQLKSDFFPQVPRNKQELIYQDDVSDNWEEILKPLTQEEVDKEAVRCMSCGLCFECDQCMIYCPQEAITRYRQNPVGHVMFTIYTKCVGCHICSEVCPTGFIDMGMGEDL